MPYSVGTAFLAVQPSLRGLHAKIAAELKGINPTVTVKPVIDKTGLKDLPPMRLPVMPETKKAEAQVGAFASAMQKRVEAAIRALPEIKLDADSSEADKRIAAIRAELAAIATKRIGVDVDTGTAQTAIARLETELAALGASSSDIRVQVDAAAAESALMVVSKEAQKLDGKDVRVRVGVDKDTLSASLIQVAQLGRALGTLAMPAAAIAVAPQLVSLAAAAAEAAGAVFLLPAAAAAAGVAVGTLVVGLSNVADALGPTGTAAQIKKVNEALAQLSPAARSTVDELRALAPAWHGLELSVQERLFQGVTAAIGILAKDYLPALRGTLTEVAGGFNGAFLELTKWLTAPTQLASVKTMLDNLGATAKTLASSFAPAAETFIQIATIGAQYLPGLATGFLDLVTRVRDFVTSAEGIAQIKDWIQGGIDAISSLMSIAGNAGGVVAGLFDAAKASGIDALGSLDDITEQLNVIFNSGVGQDALATAFSTISNVVASLTPGLVGLGAAVGTALIALGPALPPLADALTAVILALAPLLPDLVKLAVAVLPPFTAAIIAMAPYLGPVAAGLLGMWAAMKLMAIAAAIQAGLVAFTVATGAMTVAAAGSAGPLTLLSGAIRAVGFAIVANPIGILITVLAGVVAAVIYAYNHFEGFRNVVDAVLNFVLDIAKNVAAWFAGPFVDFFRTGFDLVMGVFETVRAFLAQWGTVILSVVAPFIGIPLLIYQNWGAIVQFFVDLWDGVLTTIANAGTAIAEGARAAWNWLVTAAQTAVASTLSFVANLPQNIAYALGFLAGVLARAAVAGWNGFTAGIATAWTATVAFIASVPDRITAGLSALGSFLATTATAAWASFTTGIVQAFNATLAFIQSIPDRVTAGLTSLGSYLFAVASTAWASFTSGVSQAFLATVAFVQSIPDRVVASLAALGQMLLGSGTAAIDGLTTGIVTGFNATIAFLTGLPGRITGFFSAAGTWLLAVGSDIIAGLVNGLVTAGGAVLNFFGGLIDSFLRGFRDGLGINSPSTVFFQFAVDILQGLLNGLLGFAQTIIGWVTSFVGSIAQAFQAGFSVISAVWSALWDGISSVVNAVFGAISAYVSAVFQTVVALFTGNTAAISGIWSGFWNAIRSVALAVFQAISDGVYAIFATVLGFFGLNTQQIQFVWNNFWAILQQVAATIFGNIQATIGTVFAAISGIFTTITGALSAVWSGFWSGLQSVAVTVWNAVNSFLSGAFAAFTGAFTAAWNNVQQIFIAAWNGIRDTAVNLWNAIGAFFSAAFAAYTSLFTAVWTGIQSFFATIWNAIRDTAVNLWNAISGFFTAAFTTYTAYFSAVWQAILDFFTQRWINIQTNATTTWNAISGFFTAAFTAYTTLFQTVWSTIQATFTTVWTAIQAAAVRIWGAISGFFTSAFATFAAFFSATWNGIVSNFSTIFNGIVNIAGAVWGFVRAKFVEGINFVIDIINGFAGAINSVATALGFNLNLHVNRLSDGGEVDAIRRSLGGTIELKQVIRRADGGGVDISGGGMLPGFTPGRDIYPAVAGRQRYELGGGEYVVKSRSTRELGPRAMWAINNADRLPRETVVSALAGNTRYLAAGGPVTPQQMLATVSAALPGTRMTSAYRPGDPGFHGRNRAADLAGSRSGDGPFMQRIDRWIGENYGGSAELIHTPGPFNIKNGRPFTYSAGVRADHFDHVHWANNGAGPAGAPGGGGILGVIGNFISTALHDLATAALGPVRNAINGVGEQFGFPGKMAAAIINKLLDGIFSAADAKDAAASAAGPGGEANPLGVGDQLSNARIIADVARGMGFRRNGLIVALATALQESGLRNLDYGDRDSLGLFQQRPSQGWGTPAQIRTPSYAAGKFFAALRAVRGWESLPVTVAAQRVQRSAFPDAYAKWVGKANTIASQVGFSGGGPIPALAKGGSVAPGRPHLVGERGPEVFVPQSSGSVFTAAQWQAMGAGSSSPSPRQAVSDSHWRDRARPVGAAGGPLIGTLNTAEGAGAKDVVDELVFAVKHAKRTGSVWGP